MTAPEESALAVGADAVTEDGAGLEVAVVGGGAVGATAAYDLASEGATVTLYDRETVASGASGRAAGICYDAFADPLDADLAGVAIERFRSLSGDDTFPFVECPYVWFAQAGDPDRADAIREQVRGMQERGIVALEATADDLAERFPALRTDDIAIAGIAGAAGYTDPERYTACLAAAATDAGASLETETPVAVQADPPRVVHRDDGTVHEVDAVLVAAGARSGQLLADAGQPIAMKPYRVQALVADADITEPMVYDATDDWYLRPHSAGVLVGDGTETTEADPETYDREASPGFRSTVLDRVAGRLSADNPNVDRAWAGLCTATPDRDPLVGAVDEGLYVATGFQGEGIMRAPAIGQRIATEILGGDGIDRFDPRRFDGDMSFEITSGMTIDRAD